MIPAFITIWDEHKDELATHLSLKHPTSYKELVTLVIQLLANHIEAIEAPSKLFELCCGPYYEGSYIYIITPDSSYPTCFWYVAIAYGSCCGCDTLGRIRANSSEEVPTPDQIADYMLLALHIVQGLRFVNLTILETE